MNGFVISIVSADKVYLFVGILLAVCLLVIAAILLDLWDGVHTARVTHERIHSHKLRVTVEKFSEYWRLVMIGFLIDCIGMVFAFYVLPFVTIVFGIGLILVEAKSMFEHAAKRKSHAAKLPDLLKMIVAAADERDAKKILDMLNCNAE